MPYGRIFIKQEKSKGMKDRFIVCICFFLFCSCEPKPYTPVFENAEARYVISLEEALEESEFSFEKFNGSFRYVPLETTPESHLSAIRFLGLLNDTIVVLDDARQIMTFTDNGKFIGRIGREGNGSDEYLGVKSFNFDRKSGHIMVVDFTPRVLRYDLKGNLIAVYHPDCEVVKTSDDNSLFANNYMFNYYRASIFNSYAHSFYRIDNSSRSGFFNPNPMYQCVASVWSTTPLTQLDDTIAFVKPLSDTVFQFTDGVITPRFVFRHQEPSLPQEKIDFYNHSDKELDYRIYLSRQQNEGYFVGIQDIFETKDLLLFSLNLSMNYLFDKRNKLLYKITGVNDLGSQDILFCCRNSDRNSLVAVATPLFVMSRQNLLHQDRDASKGKIENPLSEYERLILDFEEENNPIVIIATFAG